MIVKKLILSIFISFFIFSENAYAQFNYPDSIEEVVITANKFASKLSQSNKEVIVLNQAILNQYSGYSVAQLLNTVTGINVNGSYSNASKDQSVYTRGGKNDYTVILVDGIPLQDPSGIGGALDLRILNTNQIARIEIVKGAQTSLYGSDAIAGVINIITNQIQADGMNGNISLAGGSFSTLETSANIGYKKGENSMGVVIGKNSSQGISEAKDTTQQKTFDKDGFNQFNAQVFIESKLDKNITVRPFYRYNSFSGDNDSGSFTDADDKYTARLNSFGVKSGFKHNKGDLILQYSNSALYRKFHSNFGDYEYRGKTTQVETYSDFKLNAKNTFLAGIDIRHQKIIDPYSNPENPSYNTYSSYASLLSKAGKFTLQSDARYTIHSVHKRVTFSINPSFQIIPDMLKSRTSYGTGFKSPTLSQLYGPFGANLNLKPEYGTTFETGLYFDSKSKDFTAQVIYFKRNIHNLITYTVNYLNVDRQTDQGIELEFGAEISPKLSINSNYTFITGLYSSKTLSNEDTTYNNLLRKPKHRFNTVIKFQANNHWSFLTSYGINGPMKDQDFNSFPATEVNLKAYQIWNASIHYLAKKHSAYLSLNNLLNQDFQEVYGYGVRPINFKVGYVIGI